MLECSSWFCLLLVLHVLIYYALNSIATPSDLSMDKLGNTKKQLSGEESCLFKLRVTHASTYCTCFLRSFFLLATHLVVCVLTNTLIYLSPLQSRHYASCPPGYFFPVTSHGEMIK